MSGSYPAHLLDLWDEYEAAKGSESFRPRAFALRVGSSSKIADQKAGCYRRVAPFNPLRCHRSSKWRYRLGVLRLLSQDLLASLRSHLLANNAFACRRGRQSQFRSKLFDPAGLSCGH